MLGVRRREHACTSRWQMRFWASGRRCICPSDSAARRVAAAAARTGAARSAARGASRRWACTCSGRCSRRATRSAAGGWPRAAAASTAAAPSGAWSAPGDGRRCRRSGPCSRCDARAVRPVVQACAAAATARSGLGARHGLAQGGRQRPAAPARARGAPTGGSGRRLGPPQRPPRVLRGNFNPAVTLNLASRRAQGGSPDAASGSKAEVRFLIGVTSACCTAKSAGLRAGVRTTWLAFMRQRYPDVDVRFIIAQPDSPNRRARACPRGPAYRRWAHC